MMPMMLSRRSLLLGLFPVSVLALAACEETAPTGFDASADAVMPETVSTRLDAFEAVAPSALTAPAPPRLAIPRTIVAQGGTLLVGVAGDRIRDASITFREWEYPTVAGGDGRYAIVPAGQLIGTTEQPDPGRYPVSATVEIDGEAESQALGGTITVTAWDFPVEYLTFAPEVAALLDPTLAERETTALRAAYGGFTPVRLWDGFFVRPSAAGISDVYGARRSYQGGPVTGSHSGVDFGAATGAPVLAAANGRVVLARPMPVRGNMVIIDHGLGVFTGYCHLHSSWVEPGQVVRAGESIAATGATGLVTGAHLHWEVVAGLQHVDGLRWLSP